MAAPKKSDPTIIVVLLICVLMGMWQGARGMVEKASVASLFKVATALDVRLTELFGDY